MAKFNLPETAYTPAGISVLKTVTIEEARAEYARLRRAAMKRLDRLEQSEYGDSEILAYRRKRPFQPASKLTDAEIGRALSEVHHFLTQKTSSVTGMRKQERAAIKTLHSKGYTFVTKENFRAFGKFMEAARMKAGGKLLASDRVAEMYEAAERKGIPTDQLLKDFDYWRANVEELNASRKSRKENATATDYRRNIERRKKQSGTVAQRRKKG